MQPYFYLLFWLYRFDASRPVSGYTSAREDGGAARSWEYEYRDGRAIAYHADWGTVRFFYANGLPDSIEEWEDTTLSEADKFGYDANGLLIRTDTYLEPGRGAQSRHNQGRLEYFLPDSVVYRTKEILSGRDSTKSVIRLLNGLPVEMIDQEYFAGSYSVSVHRWRFPGVTSIGAKARNRKGAPRARSVYDLLGRKAFPGAGAEAFTLGGRAGLSLPGPE